MCPAGTLRRWPNTSLLRDVPLLADLTDEEMARSRPRPHHRMHRGDLLFAEDAEPADSTWS